MHYSYGIFSIVIGQILDSQNEGKSVYDLSACFYMAALFYFLSSLSLFFAKDVKFVQSKHIFRDVGKVFRNPSHVLFAFGCFFVGIFAGITWTFLVYFMNELNTSKLLMGLALAVEAFGGEVLVLIFSPSI